MLSLAMLAGSLSLLSGFADVACLSRFHSFAAMQTGNMVQIGVAIAIFDGNTLAAELTFRLAVLSSHFFAVFFFCMLAAHTTRPVLIAAPAVGLLTASAGLLDGLIDGECKWSACLVSASFGAMNFMSSPNTVLEGKLFTMVSLATGNLQKCARMTYAAMAGATFSAHETQAMQIASAVVVGTFLGAVLGGVALAYGPVDIAFMFVPVGAGQPVV